MIVARDLAQCTDEEILLRCRDGSKDLVRQGIGIIADRHHRGLINFLYRFVGNRKTAEDLAQEAFIRIYRHARNYKEIAKVSTWLYTIAKNLARNALRDRKKRPNLSLNFKLKSSGREFGATLPSDAETPSEKLERKDLQEQVHEAIGQLPETYRSAVILVDIHGYTYKEAADRLDVRVGTIRSRLYRGREKLLELLKRSPDMAEAWEDDQ